MNKTWNAFQKLIGVCFPRSQTKSSESVNQHLI